MSHKEIESPSLDSPGEPRRLLSLQFMLVIFSVFFFFLTFHAFLLLPLYIKQLGGGESDIGFIMGIAGFSTIFTTPLSGVLVDRYGRKWFLAVGGLLMALSTFPFAFLEVLGPSFYLLRILHGVAFSFCFTAAGTMVVAITPPNKRSQALGLFGVFTIINYALAPFIGKRVIENLGFQEFFIVFTVFALLTPVIAVLLKEPRIKKHGSLADTSFFVTLKRPNVWVAALTLLILGSGFITALNFLPVYSVEIGIRDYDIFFIAYTLAVMAIRIFGGWIPDKAGKKRTAVPSIAFLGLSIIAIGFSSTTGDFIVTGILFGLSHGLVYPSVYALVIGLVPEKEMGRAFAICSMSFTIGGMIGLFVYGYVAELFGYTSMYTVAGSVCLAGFLFFGLLGKERDQERLTGP